MGVNKPISTGYIENFILISCQHSSEDEKATEDNREQRRIYGFLSGLIKNV